MLFTPSRTHKTHAKPARHSAATAPLTSLTSRHTVMFAEAGKLSASKPTRTV